MISFEHAFVRTRPEVRQSIKTKLKARGFDVDGDMDNDEFLGLQPDVLPGLTDPERAAMRSALARVKGAASGSGQAGAGVGASASAGIEDQVRRCARYTAHLRIPEDYRAKRPAAAAADLDAGAAKRLAREGHVAGKSEGSAFAGREAGASGGPGGGTPEGSAFGGREAGAPGGSRPGSYIKTAAVVVGKQHIATYYNGDSHAHLQPGVEVEVYVNDGAQPQSRAVACIVETVSESRNLVLLKVKDETISLEAPVLDQGGLDIGMPFILIGQSAERYAEDMYTTSHGSLATTFAKAPSLFIQGYMVSGNCDSGGGVFSAETCKLFGMCVGQDQHTQRCFILPFAVIAALFEEPEPESEGCEPFEE